jgi:hypothetical protein
MRKLLSLVAILTLVVSVCFSQTSPRKKAKSKTMQTVRLHIDGFSKSKSGAV